VNKKSPKGSRLQLHTRFKGSHPDFRKIFHKVGQFFTVLKQITSRETPVLKLGFTSEAVLLICRFQLYGHSFKTPSDPIRCFLLSKYASKIKFCFAKPDILRFRASFSLMTSSAESEGP